MFPLKISPKCSPQKFHESHSKLITQTTPPVTATTPSHLTTNPVTTTALITSLSRRCHSPVIDPPLPSPLFHLFRNRIDLSYTNWTRHGEKDEPSISAPEPVNATTEFVDDTIFASDIPTDGSQHRRKVNDYTKDNFDEDDLVKFQELLLDAEKPLYEGYPDFTKLSAIVKLLNFKGYKKIHVCINNCLLYWKNDKDLTAYRTYGISRWKVDNKIHKVYKNIPAKVMWYWRHNSVPHSIDFMHVEKNVAEKFVGTLANVTGHVRNRNKPEGCIAKETIAEETIDFLANIINPWKLFVSHLINMKLVKMRKESHCRQANQVKFLQNSFRRLANAKTWDAIKGKTFGVQIPPTMTFAKVKIGKRNLRKIIEISSDSLEDRKGASKATAPIFYGPSTQELLDAYGYNTIEEYLSWNYFPSTDNERTDMETTNKRNTDKDCIVDSNSAMSKACTLHLQLAYAHCICTLHLQLAFASKHLHIAFAG
ncbi:hypothetical protein Tco_0941835 [Tanacetum coccineum]|uniref:Transposase n=1 Tax=Tanacetum coccineum TaxID=301880 RepID=A0ABQ5DRZ9_9ASTR